MQQIIFTCETVTPMFLAGADGSTPELRPPSIKGALRFWWRALNGHLSIEKLKEQEGAIFGDTKQRSKVIIRVEEKKVTVSAGNVKSSLLYIAYGAHSRRYIEPASKFNICISFKSNALNAQQFKELFLAMNALLHFGGLGMKSRNGFGSLQLVEAIFKNDTPNSPKENYKNLERDFLQIENISLTSRQYSEKLFTKLKSMLQPNSPAKYHSLSSDSEQISKSLNVNNWQDALEYVCGKYQTKKTDWSKERPRHAKSYFIHLGKNEDNNNVVSYWLNILSLPYGAFSAFKTSVKEDMKSFSK